MDKTLIKGLQVLEFVAAAESSVRISDVGGALNLTKSNAYRSLKTLEAAGYLRQDPCSKDFSATMRLWELGVQIDNRFDLRTRAADVLRTLAELSRETVHLAILEGNEVLYVDKIDSSEPVAAYTRLGGRAPAYCVATGKALLSHLAGEELASRLRGLQPHSEFTIVDPDALRAELTLSRKRGYAINRGEWRESVWGIAAVFRDTANTVIGAIGVSGPRYRLDETERFKTLVGLVTGAAVKVSETYQLRP